MTSRVRLNFGTVQGISSKWRHRCYPYLYVTIKRSVVTYDVI